MFAKSAQKELNKIPKAFGNRILAKIETLTEQPRQHGSIKLEGSDNTYRIRIGDYRVIYSIYDKALVVDVIKIDHRKQVSWR
ncbi:MAG: type II toxin-antitoxin system RelE/ParE family toxin [Chitinophagales bacterium]|nr:type II toxin-antitoxin system RelE/ParE family toxin [Chitinophagales bacterium]